MALYELLVLCICLLRCCEVQAISKQSDRRVLNESDLISVLPNYEDDDFNCVDIYKQPALTHPLLKNHKIQLYPKFSKKQIKSIESLGPRVNPSIEVLDKKSKGCPPGKVPIYKPKSNHQFSEEFPGEHFVTLDTTRSALFHGGRALINLNNPAVKSDQYSMAQIWVQSGYAAELNSIQVGWAVYPHFHGDNLTRYIIRWTADGFKKTGCYDFECPGYVQVHTRYGPGAFFKDVTVHGKDPYCIDIFLLQERSSGKWWWIINGNIFIGYWPKEVFNHLGTGASIVRYGGTSKDSGEGVSPPIGTGSLPGRHKVGYFAKVKIVGPDHALTDIDRTVMGKNVDTVTSCYDLDYPGNKGIILMQAFSYGGPGGQFCGI